MDDRDSPRQITKMLQAWMEGDRAALEDLVPLIYKELHKIARRNLAVEKPGHLLQPSALVNETFVRLMGSVANSYESRAHFFAFSARLMRQILVDHARSLASIKRGRGAVHVALDEANEFQPDAKSVEIIDVDVALTELAKLSERQARVVELRYFGGLENAEIAQILGISDDTVGRDWRIAKSWLYYRLRISKER